MNVVAAGPVIPNFGSGSSCETSNGWFCTDWLELSLIALGIGFVLATALALVGFRYRLLDPPIGLFADFLYTIPSLALFQLLVPFTGLTVTTVEIALISYTLLILYRNMIAGLRAVPPDALEAARGMGLTRRQTFTQVELPLALPAIGAGLRIATVSTISIATVAALVIPKGLGLPIYTALQQDIFKTEILAAGLLTIALALCADGLIVLAQRRITPWTRAA
jgi:osmoprotectant transport system permease protein